MLKKVISILVAVLVHSTLTGKELVVGTDFHCWACQTPLDEFDQKCSRCGTGTICPSCGKCKCDYRPSGGNTPQSAKELFEKLVDGAEEVRVSGVADQQKVEGEVLAMLVQESGIPDAVAPRKVQESIIPADFQDETFKAIAEVVFPRARSGQVFNPNVMKSIIKNPEVTQEAVGLCSATYDAKALPAYLEAIRNASKRGLALMAMTDVGQELLDGGQPDLETAFDAITRARDVLSRPTHLLSVVRQEREELPAYLLELEHRQLERDFIGLDTGFTHFNRVANGLCEGLTVIAGSPSVGKTTFMSQMQHETSRLNRVPTIFFSYEQSKDELRVKALARLGMVNSRDVLRGKLSVDMGQWEKVKKAAIKMFEYSELLHIIEADAFTTIDKVQAIVEGVMNRHKTDKAAVFVDYLQKVPMPEGKGFSSRREDVSFVCSEFRRLSRALHIPVVALSSEARAAYNKKTFDAFKESGEIEYSTDIAAVFQTDRVRTQEFAAKGSPNRAVDLAVVKNRNGEVGTIQFTFYTEFAWFKEGDFKHAQYDEALPNEGA